jgi:hypothetical protein
MELKMSGIRMETDLAHDRDHCPAVLNTIIKLPVS